MTTFGVAQLMHKRGARGYGLYHHRFMHMHEPRAQVTEVYKTEVTLWALQDLQS